MSKAKNIFLGATCGAFLLSSQLAFGFAEVESRAENARDKAQAEQVGAQALQQVEYLQQEVQELRGKVEELAHQLDQMGAQQQKLYLDLEAKLAQPKESIQAADKGVTLDLDEAQGLSLAPSPSQQVAQKHEEKAYQNAYKLVQMRDFDQALKAFNEQIKQYPHGKYAPNARYWIGEIHLNKGQLTEAHEAFKVVYEQYPTHPKAADALLKLGYVEQEKGQWAESKTLFNRVKTQFPNSTSAQLAEARLQKLYQQ